MEFIDVSAKTIEDAIAKGVAELSIDGRELVETKVIEQPSNGFLGIGRKPAVVRLFYTTVSAAATEEEKEVIAETSDAVSDAPVATDERDVAESVDDSPVSVKAKQELSKETQQIIAEKGKEFLEKMFAQMGLIVMIEKMFTSDKITFQVHGEETLINLAKRLAAKVKRNRQKVSLEPMNAFERKIIHTALHDDKHIVTESAGDEPFRHIVISYKK